MNRKDFYKLYEEWLRNASMDALWFSHRLDEIIDGDERDLSIYQALDKIGASVEQARPKAEYLLAKVSPGLRIGESTSDEPLPVPTAAELPAKLRELRKFNKWKLIDVAQMTGLSPSFLSDLERGVTSPSFETLQKLADVYCTPITLQVVPVVGLVGFIGYGIYLHATGIHEGEIYRKEYSAAYDTTDSHIVTNGKTTTTYYTPRHVDATYRLLIRARGDDGKEQTNWFDVPKDVWDGSKVGQWYDDNCVCIEAR